MAKKKQAGSSGFNIAPAEREGWILHIPLNGAAQKAPMILALNPGPFAAHGHAIAFVRERADEGSAYHTDALRRAGLL